MNKYQKAVAVVAVANLLLILLFPPYLDSPLARFASRNFESFYFVLLAPAGHPIYQPLLIIEVAFVMANALAIWLAVASRSGEEPHFTDATLAGGFAAFVAVNAGIILLFPPFQPYSSLVRVMPEGFDGFYFAFGDKRHRQLFMPFLYLESILVAVNVLVIWLLFQIMRHAVTAEDEQLIEMVHHIPPDKVEALVASLKAQSAAATPAPNELGRKVDRRRRQDPSYRGPERRSGHDRRNEPHLGPPSKF